MTTIRTERLLLRHARPDDAVPMHAIMRDPVAMRYWSSLPHSDMAETEAWIGSMIERNRLGSPDFILEMDGAVIGKAGAYQLPEFGYILHPDHWGRGLAREALAALIPHIFAHYEVDALNADIDPRNGASIRLLERLGFERTGSAARTWHIGDEWCDSVYYTLKRSPA